MKWKLPSPFRALRDWLRRRRANRFAIQVRNTQTFLVPQYGYPELLERDFENCLEKARQIVQTMDLGVQNPHALDLLVLLEADRIFCEKILFRRLQNQQTAMTIDSQTFSDAQAIWQEICQQKEQIAKLDVEIEVLKRHLEEKSTK